MKQLISTMAAAALAALVLVPVASAQANASGDWALTFNTDQGPIEATLAMKVSGQEVTGKLSSPQGEGPIKGTIEGSNLKFSMDFSGPQGSIAIEFTAEIAGQAMKGEASFGQGSILFYGKKK